MNDDSVKKLTEEYIKIQKNIFELLAHPKNEKAIEYAQRLTDEVNKGINLAISKANQWGSYDLKQEAKKAEDRAKNALKDEPKVLSMRETDMVLKKHSGQSGRQAITLGTIAEMSAGARQAGKEFKRVLKSKISQLEKEGRTSVWDLCEELKKQFTQENILAVKYANGMRVPLDKYTAMLGRTALVEVHNYATVRATISHGHDLVYWHSVDNPCRICALYRNKVYSISGQDKRFPYLFNTALHPGYWTVHPNERCTFTPWIEKLYTPQEVADMSRKSVIPKDKTIDLRSERERKAYAAAQAFNRQVYIELQEFNRMKEVLGKELPYKTLGGFRRAKRADSQNYEEVKKLYYEREPIEWKMQRNRRYDNEQFENIRAILGDEAPKDVAHFQDIKYNDNIQLKYLVKKAKAYSEGNESNRLPEFDKAVITEDKTKGYALNPDHPIGKDKAKVIDAVLGYNQDNYQDFEKVLLNEIKHMPIKRSEVTEYGKKFTVFAIVKGLKGRYMELETVWQIDIGKSYPRLITVVPGKKEK